MHRSPSNVLAFHPPNRRKTFSIRLSDDSLLEAGLPAGSLLDFIPSTEYTPGACVAVQTPDGLFVKYIYPAPNDYLLFYGAHEGCRPRLYHRSEVGVQGVLAVPSAAVG